MKKFRLGQINVTAFLAFCPFAVTTFSQTKPSTEPTATPAPKPKKQVMVIVTSGRV